MCTRNMNLIYARPYSHPGMSTCYVSPSIAMLGCHIFVCTHVGYPGDSGGWSENSETQKVQVGIGSQIPDTIPTMLFWASNHAGTWTLRER